MNQKEISKIVLIEDGNYYLTLNGEKEIHLRKTKNDIYIKLLLKIQKNIHDIIYLNKKRQLIIIDIFGNLAKYNLEDYLNPVVIKDFEIIFDPLFRVNNTALSNCEKFIYFSNNFNFIKIYSTILDIFLEDLQIPFNTSNHVFINYENNLLIAGDSLDILEINTKNFEIVKIYKISNLIENKKDLQKINYNQIISNQNFIFLIFQSKKILIINIKNKKIKIEKTIFIQNEKIYEMKLNKDCNYICINISNKMYFINFFSFKKRDIQFTLTNFDENFVTKCEINYYNNTIICVDNFVNPFSFKIYDKKLIFLNTEFRKKRDKLIYDCDTKKQIIKQELFNGFILNKNNKVVQRNIKVYRVLIKEFNNYKLFNIINILKKEFEYFFIIYNDLIYVSFNGNIEKHFYNNNKFLLKIYFNKDTKIWNYDKTKKLSSYKESDKREEYLKCLKNLENTNITDFNYSFNKKYSFGIIFEKNNVNIDILVKFEVHDIEKNNKFIINKDENKIFCDLYNNDSCYFFIYKIYKKEIFNELREYIFQNCKYLNFFAIYLSTEKIIYIFKENINLLSKSLNINLLEENENMFYNEFNNTLEVLKLY